MCFPVINQKHWTTERLLARTHFLQLVRNSVIISRGNSQGILPPTSTDSYCHLVSLSERVLSDFFSTRKWWSWRWSCIQMNQGNIRAGTNECFSAIILMKLGGYFFLGCFLFFPSIKLLGIIQSVMAKHYQHLVLTKLAASCWVDM